MIAKLGTTCFRRTLHARPRVLLQSLTVTGIARAPGGTGAGEHTRCARVRPSHMVIPAGMLSTQNVMHTPSPIRCALILAPCFLACIGARQSRWRLLPVGFSPRAVTTSFRRGDVLKGRPCARTARRGAIGLAAAAPPACLRGSAGGAQPLRSCDAQKDHRRRHPRARRHRSLWERAR